MDSSEQLLREIIRASNRTTRAVRAFVRFLFIQLSAITLAILVYQIGVLTQDSSECSYGICPPSPGWTIFAGLIWVVGVVWSSGAGWSELELSNPAKSDADVQIAVIQSEKNAAAASSEGDISLCSKCSLALKDTDRACSYCGTDRFSNLA